jgi:diguanylate cyclase (GGDEF)-like protein/PAS domain S-box-containing protein
MQKFKSDDEQCIDDRLDRVALSLQVFRYAEDLRVLLETHQRLQVDYDALVGSFNQIYQQGGALERLLQDGRNLYVATDASGQVARVNPAAAAYLGDGLRKGADVRGLLSPEVAERLLSRSGPLRSGTAKAEVRLRDVVGAVRPFKLLLLSNRDRDGSERLHWLFFPADSDSETGFAWDLGAAAFNKAGEGIVVMNARGEILAVNPALCRLSGYREEELKGLPLDTLAADFRAEAASGDLWQGLRESGQWQGRIRGFGRGGDARPVWLAVTASRNPGGVVDAYIGVFSDMSPLLENEDRLKHSANYDALTQLPNRNLFLDRLQSAIVQGRRRQEAVTLLFIDLDGFKIVNDTHGHDVGDLVLQEAALRMTDAVRESDTVARYGGDEFAVLLGGLDDESDVVAVTRKLQAAFHQPLALQGAEADVGLSIGCAQYPRHAGDATALLRLADQAMYRAKVAGGRRCVMHRGGPPRSGVPDGPTGTLERMLEERQLVLAYQPRFDLSAEPPRLLGVEALLRCRGADGGLCPPATLLEEVESNRQLRAFNRWLLDTACRQLKRWRDGGWTGLGLSLNVCARQMGQREFLDDVRGALALFDNGGAGQESPLDFDVTGLVSVVRMEGVRDQLRLLRQLGIGLSLQDAAAEPIGIETLSGLPLSMLTIGPGTLAALRGGPEGLAQCRAVAALADALGLAVGAVGIETPAQLATLRDLGYRQGQGYLLGRPMEAGAFAEWWVAADASAASA